MKTLPHKTQQQLHANRRAEERLGIHFNNKKAREIIRDIKDGIINVGYKISNRRTWFKIELENRECYALYDKQTCRIVTFLDIKPKEWEENE